MKYLIILLLLPSGLLAQKEKDFTIKGKMKLLKPADWIYISYRSGDNSVRDSFKLSNNRFVYKGKIMEPVLSSIRVTYPKAPEEARPKFEVLQLFLEPGTTRLEITDSVKNNKVKGSDAHKDFLALTKSQEPYSQQFTQLYSDWSRLNKEKKQDSLKVIESRIDALDAHVKETVFKNFVTSNPRSPVALHAVKQYAGYDLDAAKVEPLFLTLPEDTRRWASAVAFQEQLDIAKKTAVGSFAMDFTQNDTLGIPVTFSSFRGKYVLIDFWASWCGPCRVENPNVVKVFNTYKDKNFTVLGVSLDRPNAKDKWLKAIHDDKLAWTHVSDLKYWDNEVAKQYGIRAIPQNLLVGPDGRIIAKNLRGAALEEKMNEVLSGSGSVKTF